MSGFKFTENYSKLPHVLVDKMLADMDLVELKVTIVILRKTVGFNKEKDRISLSQLQKLTGLSRQGVISGIEKGISRGTIKKHETKKGNVYSLVYSVDQMNDEVVNSVDQTSQLSRPEVVNSVDTQKKAFKENKQEKAFSENLEPFKRLENINNVHAMKCFTELEKKNGNASQMLSNWTDEQLNLLLVEALKRTTPSRAAYKWADFISLKDACGIMPNVKTHDVVKIKEPQFKVGQKIKTPKGLEEVIDVTKAFVITAEASYFHRDVVSA